MKSKNLTDTVFLISSKQLIIRVLIKQILKNNGYKKYIFAINGQEAIRKICDGETRVEFIISDWNMPIINGVELLKMLKNDPEYFIIPFMLLSPDKSLLKNIYAMEEGAEHYSAIPFTETSLMQTIESCINEQLCERPEKTSLNEMVRSKLTKDYDKVIDLGSALPNIERNQKASILTGESLFHTEQYDRAQKVLKDSLRYGKNSKILDLLGRIHAKKGEDASSLECFERAKKHNPLY